MAQNIAELMDIKNLAQWYEQRVQALPPYVGESYFPNVKINSDILSYLNQAQGAPVLAKANTYDGRPIPENRQGFATEMFKTNFFRSSMATNEQDLVDLNNALVNNNDSFVQSAVTRIYDDRTQPILGMRARREYMAMQALMTGQVVIKSNGVNNTITYQSDPDLQLTAGTDWSDEKNADPFADIIKATDELKAKHGITPNQILMNTNTFRELRNNEKLKATLYTTNINVQNAWLPESTIINAMLSELHVIPVIYDQGYQDEGTGQFMPFVPDGKVVLMNAPIPSVYARTGNGQTGIVAGQPIGHMAFAPTPEELGLQRGKIDASNLAFFDVGVAYHEVYDQFLVQTETVISMNALPSFEGSRAVVRMDVSKPASTTGSTPTGTGSTPAGTGTGETGTSSTTGGTDSGKTGTDSGTGKN
ncbi:hypothetical protein IWT140_01714 [Secundilactobacillus pentosiphilus]|uniref:Major capsid protein n=1 Tax=Secundilactobacillus pentosiphilus TaxID=1714682 RepID=A0A1Z5IQP2_9LACO|nr:major capsid protein [Secundilactobacillus pentosiphilus]GAX04077.1 hypothetical protein IWT140_01714 [Secundilactobacillus pentosiphilus]